MSKQSRIFWIVALAALSIIAFPTGSFGPDEGIIVSVPAFLGSVWLFGGLFK